MNITIKDTEYSYETIYYQDYIFLSIKQNETKDEWMHNLGQSKGSFLDNSTIESQLSNLQEYGLDDTFKQRK